MRDMARQGSSLAFGVIFLQLICVFGSSCHWKYYMHYEQKGCTAVLGKNGCPIRFHCEELSGVDLKSCVHNGRVYKNGDDIKELGACDSCSCIVEEGSAHIECASVDCPAWETRKKSCYMGYKPTECCPMEICPKEKEMRNICNYKGKDYRIGQIIETSNRCKTCICTKKWIDEDGPGCSAVNCLTGIYAKKIRNGCIPIYSEDSCCFTELYCNGVHGSTPTYMLIEDKGNYCHYKGKYYKRGSTVFLDADKHHCISCKCTTPPDFTCLRKKCLPKPKDNCMAVYGHCCPQYECP